jgi:hypothetical protein
LPVARGLGSVSINVRITAVRKLAAEAADNGLLAPELAAGIARVKSAKSMGVRTGNWLFSEAGSSANGPAKYIPILTDNEVFHSRRLGCRNGRKGPLFSNVPSP